MKTRLLVAGSSKETGALLKEYIQQRGVEVTKTAQKIISYGVPADGALNGVCGRGKIFNMTTMSKNGVRTVPWFEGAAVPSGISFPLLARKTHGYGGTDLVPVFQPEEIPWRLAAGWDWFSSYVPLLQEYRVWVFQGQHLDTYQKQMNRPSEYAYIGRNFRNGFDFVPARPEQDVTAEAIKAVQVLGLDFAAVDLLRGKDGLVYVLETNTAPGVIRSNAQSTLGKLADCMVNWLRA